MRTGVNAFLMHGNVRRGGGELDRDKFEYIRDSIHDLQPRERVDLVISVRPPRAHAALSLVGDLRDQLGC